MTYALISAEGVVVAVDYSKSFVWRGAIVSPLTTLTKEDKIRFGIYDYAMLHKETPEGKRQCGFTQEINHAEGVVYEVPIFIDKTEAELAREKNEKIKAEIAAIESSVTPRRYREAVLSDVGKDWLVAQDVKITELRAQLVPEISIPAE